jgi:copper(I)-binding protein
MRLRRFSHALAAALVIAASAAWGQSADTSLRVDGAWARRALMLQGTGTGAVYAALVNAGKTPDALVSASTDAAGVVEIHETYQESGLSRMRPVTRIPIPPGKTVEMKPGGYHIMLIDLKRDLKAGEIVPMTLVFQNAGKLTVNAQVK